MPSAPSSVAADRAIRNQKQIAHVKQLWWFLASVVTFFTLIRVGRYLAAKFSSISKNAGASTNEKGDEELNKKQQVITSPLQRTAYALSTGFRITFFRFSVPVGLGCIMSISELSFILIYITANLLWLLVDSQFWFCFIRPPIAHNHTQLGTSPP